MLFLNVVEERLAGLKYNIDIHAANSPGLSGSVPDTASIYRFPVQVTKSAG